MSQILTVEDLEKHQLDLSSYPASCQSFLDYFQSPAAAQVYSAEKIAKNVAGFKCLLKKFSGENTPEKNYIAVFQDYKRGREIKKTILAKSLEHAYKKAFAMQTTRVILESVLVEGVR